MDEKNKIEKKETIGKIYRIITLYIRIGEHLKHFNKKEINNESKKFFDEKIENFNNEENFELNKLYEIYFKMTKEMQKVYKQINPIFDKFIEKIQKIEINNEESYSEFLKDFPQEELWEMQSILDIYKEFKYLNFEFFEKYYDILSLDLIIRVEMRFISNELKKIKNLEKKYEDSLTEQKKRYNEYEEKLSIQEKRYNEYEEKLSIQEKRYNEYEEKLSIQENKYSKYEHEIKDINKKILEIMGVFLSIFSVIGLGIVGILNIQDNLPSNILLIMGSVLIVITLLFTLIKYDSEKKYRFLIITGIGIVLIITGMYLYRPTDKNWEEAKIKIENLEKKIDYEKRINELEKKTK